MRQHLRNGVRVLICLVLFALLAGCSVRETLYGPSCSGPTSALIAAQSVPTAQLLPCFEQLPTGWEMATVQINQGGTHVMLDSDRAGESAAEFNFAATCDVPPQAVSTPSERAGTQRFDVIERVTPSFRAMRYYVFDGGCVWWRFDFDRNVRSALSIELDNAVMFLERHVVNDNLREDFVDADL